MDWKNLSEGVGARGRPIDWRVTARLLVLLAIVLFALEAHNFFRIRAFSAQRPEVIEAGGKIWFATGRQPTSALVMDTEHGAVGLSCRMPSAIGGGSIGIDAGSIVRGEQATGAWIDAPAGLISSIAHCPIRLEQRGRVLFQLEAVDIVDAPRACLGTEAALVAVTLFVMPLLFLVVTARRDARLKAATSVASHRRRQMRNEHEV